MAERHYLPKSCCLVFSVRTGATILAIMGIIGSGMNLASDSYGLAVIAPQIEDYIDEYRIRSYEEFAAKGSPVSERQIYETLWRQLEFVQDLVPWVFVVQIVYASIQFIVSICLLVGIMKKRPALMKPWLFITMFSLLAGFAVLCMAFVVMALATPGGIMSAIILFSLATPFLILGYYFWSVVRAAYLELLLNKTDVLPTLCQNGKKYQKM